MPLWSTALPTPPMPTPRVLRVVRDVWSRMVAQPRAAGPILSAALREARTLGSKERPVAGDMLLGMIRHERALTRLAPDPVDAWLRLAAEGVPDLPDGPEAYAVATSLPAALADEWWARLGPDSATELARTIAGRAPVALRVLHKDAFRRGLLDLGTPRGGLTRGGGAPPIAAHRVGGWGLVLDEGVNVYTLDAFRAGHVIVQDLGSQAIVDKAWEMLGSAGPGARVLDLCSGAGGKALGLAALGAQVQAWDVRQSALQELVRRARQARLPITIGPPRGRYDLVLVDAPCSGTGVLRRHPENRWKLDYPFAVQRQLLAEALTLAPHVLYATCALTRMENEEGVRTVGTPDTEQTLWPAPGAQDGFFLATFTRDAAPRTRGGEGGGGAEMGPNLGRLPGTVMSDGRKPDGRSRRGRAPVVPS